MSIMNPKEVGSKVCGKFFQKNNYHHLEDISVPQNSLENTIMRFRNIHHEFMCKKVLCKISL